MTKLDLPLVVLFMHLINQLEIISFLRRFLMSL